MKASTIVTIALRVFALQWAATGIISLLTLLGFSTTAAMLDGASLLQRLLTFAIPLSYLILACVAWFFSSWIAKRVVPQSDPELRSLDVSPRDLYGLGILVVGITAFLSHLAPMLNLIHYLVVNQAGETLMAGKNGDSFYQVTKEVIPCLAGAALALASSNLGARLARARA